MIQTIDHSEPFPASSQAGLQERVLRGGAWLVGADLANRALGLLKMVVLARLLAPRDFGLMGIALLVLSWFDMFSQTGFAAALIRKPGDVRPYLGTFWTIQVIRGVLLASLLFAGAPVVGWIFHSADVIPIVRVIAVVALFKGVANPAVIYLRKDLRLDREVIWRVGGNLVGLLVAIPFAFAYRNVWALVAAALAANVAELALSYWVVAHKPRFEMDWAKAREMMHFGKWIFWANTASYLSLYADGWAVGRFLGGSSLGYYQVAQQFGMTPLASFGGHIGAVALPAFAKLQDRASLRAAYLRSVRFSSTALIPVGALASVFADTAVRLILGEKWMSVCPLLRLLVWAGILSAITHVSLALLQAIGQPRQSTWALFLKFASFAVLFYPLMKSHGLNGVAFATMISGPISFCYVYTRVASVLGWGWDMALVFRPALLACAPLLVPIGFATWPAHVSATLLIAFATVLACLAIAGRELWTLSRTAG